VRARSRRAASFALIAFTGGACLSLDRDELTDQLVGVDAGLRPSGSAGSRAMQDAGRSSGGAGGKEGAAAGGASGATAGPAEGGAGGGGTTGPAGAAGSVVDAGHAGSAGASGAGQGGGSVAGDGGARVCKGGITGMCPTPYSVAGGVDALCKAYCDCMMGPCSANMPANCMATCKSNIDKWDLCCRLNKCLTRPCDYKDQFIGDCKAAAGIQACLDKS
jgi:hypothetical protein